LYITIIFVFLTAFPHVLVYLVLRYTTGMTLLKISFRSFLYCMSTGTIAFVVSLLEDVDCDRGQGT